MKQKIIDFKSKIRRAQILSIFSKNREQIKRMREMQSNAAVAQLNIFHRQRNMFSMNRRETQMAQNIEGFDQAQYRKKWDGWDFQLVTVAESGNYQAYESTLYQVYASLKKISSCWHPALQSKQLQLINYFLQKFLLVNIVNIFVRMPFSSLSPGLLQNISKTSVSILELCIHLQPQIFTQDIFINSNVLPFLGLALGYPSFDEDHITKILIIMVHMVIASAVTTKELFRTLNSSGSKFNFGAVFFNIVKLKLKAQSNASINFIIFLKYYLLEIENQARLPEQAQNQQSSAQKAKRAQQIIGLTQQQLDVALQLTIQAVNQFSQIDFTGQDSIFCLEESLQVLRILVQLFRLTQRHQWSIKYDRIIDLLSFKNCPSQIKHLTLVIIDHFIYTDISGNQTIYFVQSCDLIDRLWGLRKEFQAQVLNIFCNLALQKNIRTSLQRYAHQIFLNLKFERSEMLYTFIHNWFCMQKFEIQSALDQLVIQELLYSSEQNDEILIERECLLWFHLCKSNPDLQVPRKILLSESKVAQSIRQELGLHQEQL